MIQTGKEGIGTFEQQWEDVSIFCLQDRRAHTPILLIGSRI